MHPFKRLWFLLCRDVVQCRYETRERVIKIDIF